MLLLSCAYHRPGRRLQVHDKLLSLALSNNFKIISYFFFILVFLVVTESYSDTVPWGLHKIIVQLFLKKACYYYVHVNDYIHVIHESIFAIF